MKSHENLSRTSERCKSDEFTRKTTNKHAIFTSDAFEMENTIKMQTQQSLSYHNTLAQLEDEIAMNLMNKLSIYMKTNREMYSRWETPSTRQ